VKIFFSAPYMEYFSFDTGMEQNYRDRILKMISIIEEEQITVLSAHIRKSSDINIDTPEDAVKYDFQGIKEADFLIAFIGDDIPSYGVVMEIGFAAALRKRIYLFHHININPFPFLIKGLNIWTETIFIEYLNDFDAEGKLISLLNNELN